MRRQQQRPVLVVQLLRVVEQEHVAGLGKGVEARGRGQVEPEERVVPLPGERVPHVLAEQPERRELGGGRLEGARPVRRGTVHLIADGQGRRMQHDVRVPQPPLTRAIRALNARWSTITWSGRTLSTIRSTSRAISTGFQRRSLLRASAWKVSVSTMPRRVASKNPRSASSSPLGCSSARITPRLEPRPSCRLTRSKPNDSTMPAVAGPLATTTRSPASRQAVPRVASGNRWEA